MPATMDVIFLGVNDVGMRIYEWLTERDGVNVQCLITEQDQLQLIETMSPNIIVSVGFGHLVPEEILRLPSEGCLNLHPAYLPYNRGANPNVWSIVEDTPAGVTLHYMSPSFDEGDIIERRRVQRRFDDTGRSLYRRLEKAEFELFTDIWPDIERGDIDTETQDPDSGTYHTTKDFNELCRLDPRASYEVEDLLDILRALTFPPFDNAYVDISGERFYVDIDITHEDELEDGTREGLLESY